MGDRAPQRPHYAPGVPASIEEPSSTLDGLLAEAARDYPHRIAVDFLGRTITYAELDHQTRKAAGALHRAGVRAGDVVAHLGIIGPTRMDYPSTIASVRAVARYVSRILTEG